MPFSVKSRGCLDLNRDVNSTRRDEESTQIFIDIILTFEVIFLLVAGWYRATLRWHSLIIFFFFCRFFSRLLTLLVARKYLDNFFLSSFFLPRTAFGEMTRRKIVISRERKHSLGLGSARPKQKHLQIVATSKRNFLLFFDKQFSLEFLYTKESQATRNLFTIKHKSNLLDEARAGRGERP